MRSYQRLLRSRRKRMDEPESAAIRRSLVILRSAVSVLWRGWKPVVGKVQMELVGNYFLEDFEDER